jgi:hypothetical protein
MAHEPRDACPKHDWRALETALAGARAFDD